MPQIYEEFTTCNSIGGVCSSKKENILFFFQNLYVLLCYNIKVCKTIIKNFYPSSMRRGMW